MNNRIKILIFIILLISFISCKKEQEENSEKDNTTNSSSKIKTYYTCSMHPQIKEKKNGKCPICHMNLTKIEFDESQDFSDHISQNKPKTIWYCKNFPDVTSEVPDICPMDGSQMVKKVIGKDPIRIIAKLKLRKAQVNHFKPEFFPVTKMVMIKRIRLLGSVLQSEEKESNIPARIGGRVEKVYVKSTGSMVKKGDPVVKVYSPKLITAGEEYLLAKKSYLRFRKRGLREMLQRSEERLKLWGIKRFQLEKWHKNKKVPRKIKIYSNVTGIVKKRNAVIGRYFKEGQNFFELSDLSDVWVEMDVYEHDSSLVKIGQKVDLEFTALPGEKMRGEIDFVSPVLDSMSRTLKVRTTIQNKNGRLKPGMIANTSLSLEIGNKPLVIPRAAIIDTGKRKVVWVKVGPNDYRAKIIQTGYESEGYVAIRKGLKEGEEVVVEGNFLLDAQAQLFGGYEDFSPTSDDKG